MSIDINFFNFEIFFNDFEILNHSFCEDISCDPGLVDSPPISNISQPLSNSFLALANDLIGELNFPPSENCQELD